MHCFRVVCVAIATGLGLLVAGVASPADAMSVKEFHNTSPTIRKGAALSFALMAEAYRNFRQGQSLQSSCINEHFIIKGTEAPQGFRNLSKSLASAKDDETVEGHILGAIEKYCPTGASVGTSNHTLYKPVPVSEFTAYFDEPNRNYALRMAFSFQAFREAAEGSKDRGQCIVRELVTNDPSKPSPKLALVRQQIEQAVASGDAAISSRETERYILGAMNAICP